MTKPPKIFIFAFLTFSSLVFGLSQLGNHYNYALDRETHPGACASFFENGQRYDFSTVIWTAGGDCKTAINGSWWSPYYVYTTHVTTAPDRPPTVDIIFESLPAEDKNKSIDIQIIKDSISVTLSAPDGTPIPTDKSAFYKARYNQYQFTQYYSLKLPDHLIETIEFEMMVDGKRIEVTQRYHLKLRLHYNFWDQIQGI